MAKILTLVRSPEDIEEDNCKLIEFHFSEEKAESLYSDMCSGVIPGDISTRLLSLNPSGIYIVAVAIGDMGEEDFRETDIELRIVH